MCPGGPGPALTECTKEGTSAVQGGCHLPSRYKASVGCDADYPRSLGLGATHRGPATQPAGGRPQYSLQRPCAVGPHDDGMCSVDTELSLGTPCGWGHIWEWGVTANGHGSPFRAMEVLELEAGGGCTTLRMC